MESIRCCHLWFKPLHSVTVKCVREKDVKVNFVKWIPKHKVGRGKAHSVTLKMIKINETELI